MSRSKKAAKKAPRHRPVPAPQRQLRLPGVALRTRSGVQGRDQPARRVGDDHRRHPCRTADLHAGPVRRAHGDEGVGERTPARRIQLLERQAAHRAVVVVARGCGDDDRGPLRRHPATDPVPVGRGRFRGVDRRCAGGGAAQRRRVVVSVRRPSQLEGQLSHPDQHRESLSRDCQRRVEVPADTRGDDDVDLRTGRADVHLSGHASDRRCTSRTGCRRRRCRCTRRCPLG